MNHNKKVAFIGLLLLLLLTYFRENLLLAINANLALADFDRSYSYWFSDFFKDMPKGFLMKWKWGLTVFISVLMTVVTAVSLFYWFRSKQILKIVGILYAFVYLVLCLLALVGYVTNSFNEIYFVLRKILGIVQSPIPFFAFFTLFYWSDKKK
jgi:hypothetical protein